VSTFTLTLNFCAHSAATKRASKSKVAIKLIKSAITTRISRKTHHCNIALQDIICMGQFLCLPHMAQKRNCHCQLHWGVMHRAVCTTWQPWRVSAKTHVLLITSFSTMSRSMESAPFNLDILPMLLLLLLLLGLSWWRWGCRKYGKTLHEIFVILECERRLRRIPCSQRRVDTAGESAGGVC